MAVKSSKIEQNPTLPCGDDEVERVLVAARALTGLGRYGPKIEPMVLLLRYSDLRIQDAACLQRVRLVNDKLFQYQQKTGKQGGPSTTAACAREAHCRQER